MNKHLQHFHPCMCFIFTWTFPASPAGVEFQTVNSTAVRLTWSGSVHLYICIQYTVYYSATRVVISRYERVYSPGVTSTIMVLDDDIIPNDVYVHSFTLYYIIDYVKLIPGPHTDVTFSFGEHLMKISTVKFYFLLCRYEALSDSVWTILPLSGLWGKSL